MRVASSLRAHWASPCCFRRSQPGYRRSTPGIIFFISTFVTSHRDCKSVSTKGRKIASERALKEMRQHTLHYPTFPVRSGSYQLPLSWDRAASTSGRVPASTASAAPLLWPLCVPAVSRHRPWHVFSGGREHRSAGSLSLWAGALPAGGLAWGTCLRVLG